MREQQLALEDQAHPSLADRHGQQVGAAQHGPALHVDEPGHGVQERALASTVGSDDRQHLARLGGEGGPDAVGDPQVGHEPAVRGGVEGGAHGVPIQWSRSATSTPIETSSITRLSDSAASWSAWRVT